MFFVSDVTYVRVHQKRQICKITSVSRAAIYRKLAEGKITEKF